MKLRTYYYDDTNPPAVKETTLYSNNDQDWTFTQFDRNGQALYVIRHETLNDGHTKQYFNDILVYEGVQTPDHTKPPFSSCYYYPDGSIMIKYVINEEGTGSWQFYEENGNATMTLAISDKNRNVTKRSTIFLTSTAAKEPLTVPEWEAVKQRFMDAYKKEETYEKLGTLTVPAFLQEELDKTDWEKLSTAMRRGKELPKYINGLLGEDPEIADSCYAPIWMEIEHQGTLYYATYKVGSIIATFLPRYATVPAAQSRLVNFLFEIMALPDIDYGKKYYEQLTTPLQTSVQLFRDIAANPDDNTARKALYLLLHAGQQLPETATFFKQTWDNKQHSLFRRSYAAFALGNLYLRTDQQPALIAEFSSALETAEEKIIRLILAIHLVTATKEDAQNAWLAELINTLTEPETVMRDFTGLHPFAGDHDVQEYILMILGYANPDILEKNIVPVIAMLPTVNALKQVTLFKAIFSVLFREESALENSTPVRKQALLAAADAVDKEPGFVNHAEIFLAYGLPHNALKLRQLAGK